MEACVKDMKPSDQEAIELINKLMSGLGGEDEASEWRETLEKSGLYGISDLIFHDYRDLTPEQILEEAKKYKVIQL